MNHKKLFIKIFSFLILFISFFVIGSSVQAGTSPVTGWAWSSNIGWISFNSTNDGAGTGSSYNVSFSTSTLSNIGTFAGWAWSPNIGWISFGAGDGSHPNVTTNLTTGEVTGYARACAGTVNGDCSSADRTDGWDGWISMSDNLYYRTGLPYVSGNEGITYNPADGYFKGYAWGDTNVGWLTFTVDGGKGIKIVPPEEDPSCSFGSYSVIGNDVTLNWDISNDTNNYTLRRNGSIISTTINPSSNSFLDSDRSPGSYSYTLTGSTGNTCSSGSVIVGTSVPSGNLMWVQNDPSMTQVKVRVGQPAIINWDVSEFVDDAYSCNVRQVPSDAAPDISASLPTAIAGADSEILPASLLAKGIYDLKIICSKATFQDEPTNQVKIIVTSGSISEQ